MVLAGLLLSAAPSGAEVATEPAGCLDRAAAWAEVHPTLLRAIAWVESRGDHRALNRNRNGSYDVGLMQINSSWYHRGLKAWWMHLGHPCVNVAAGAWVLKQCTAEYRYTWDAVGCYNVGSGWTTGPKRRAGLAYIRKVQVALGVNPSARGSSSKIDRRLQKSALDQIPQARNDQARTALSIRTHASIGHSTMNARRAVGGATSEVVR